MDAGEVGVAAEAAGPDPLNGDAPEAAMAKIGKSKKAIGALLMDQSVIAGLGNIYRAELLFRARLSPFVIGRDVPNERLLMIWKEAAPLMRAGMGDRRIVTTLPEDRPSGPGKALKDEAHYVYRRNGRECFICGTKVMRQEMEGRNLFWCPTCQPD